MADIDLFNQPPPPGVRDTSKRAYHDHKDEGLVQDQQERILSFLRGQDGLTRSEIADRLHMRLSSVCGRVHELLDAGLVKDNPRRICSITGRKAHSVTTT